MLTVHILMVALGTASASAELADSMNDAPMAPARDGSIAIREELDAARRAGTLAAYDLFVARHPRHPLARTAREERRRVAERLGRRRR